MNRRLPQVRVYNKNGYLRTRDVLSLSFFMRHPHTTVSYAVKRALDSYLRAIGPDKISIYADPEGQWQEFDQQGRVFVTEQLRHPDFASVHLAGSESNHLIYCFTYRGRPEELHPLINDPDAVSAVSFALPTEYLHEHGSERVRELAMELGSALPFCFGQAGLAFSRHTVLTGTREEELALAFRHPGMDVSNVNAFLSIGTRVRASSWMTFLGNPVLDELGGVTGLRARLHSPQTTVEEIAEHRAVITLGPEPEAGDIQQGELLPAYRELARVLEPWLYQKPQRHLTDDLKLAHRWERRFLD